MSEAKLRESIWWMAQTVHQAYHEGSIEDCQKATCRHALEVAGMVPAVPEIHVVHHGAALCGMSGMPGQWPKGHVWVPLSDHARASCGECRAVALSWEERREALAGPEARADCGPVAP